MLVTRYIIVKRAAQVAALVVSVARYRAVSDEENRRRDPYHPWFLVNYLIKLGVVMTLCVALASLGFYFIESPFLKLRKRYVSQGSNEVKSAQPETQAADMSGARGRLSKREEMVE